MSTSANSLHVVDLGLDFKSFSAFVDEQGRPLIGNQFHFAAAEIADKFLPTCGLLTAVLHGYAATANSALGVVWLEQYKRLQVKLCEDMKSVDAANTLNYLSQYPAPLVGPLFELLDRQMNISGSNAPSQRRVNVDSKHALCNLHLNERACHQGVHCNQLHLSSEENAHRHDFYTHVVEVLKLHGVGVDSIRQRLVDAMFFAKYGNRVTVEVGGQHYQFFKTLYTDGRVFHALKLDTAAQVVVPPGTQPHKPQRLPGDPRAVLSELTSQANEIINEQASPTTRKWNAMLESFVDRLPPDAASQPIAPELAKQLQVGMDTAAPSSPDDGITPLIQAVHKSRFETSV